MPRDRTAPSHSSSLYLIVHKVRGEPAFDIAQQIECGICRGVGSADNRPEDDYEGPPCNECDGTGHWWVIPTSGHRAYPYWECKLSEIYVSSILCEVPELPADLPDHYTVSASKTKAKAGPSDLLKSLGLAKKAEPMNRKGL